VTSTVERIDVAGCEIVVTRAGPREAPPLVLLHAAGGHRGWWSGVIPSLANRFSIAIPDLSGHGDSGRRPRYTPEAWAAEVAAVIQAMGSGPTSLAGHSMGSLVAIYAAANFPGLVDRVILIDSPVLHVRVRDEPPSLRTYPDRDTAVSRFRVRPGDTIAEPGLIRRIAEEAAVDTGEGWAWKYDPLASRRFSVPEVRDALTRVRAPVACIYGGRSPYFDAGTVDYLQELLARPVPSIRIADAYHHVPLDAPEAVGAAIASLMEAPEKAA
jgi:pimeloyl-ACP methyl ester carboxylesterase